MAFSIIANIHTQTQVEITSQTPTPAFMEAIAANYGGTAADYTYYTLTEEETTRLENGDEYLLVWDGEKLTGLDFKPEDNKGWLRAEVTLSSNKVALNSIDVQKVKVFDKGTVYVQNDLVYNENTVWKCQEVTASKDPGINEAWSKEASAVLLTLTILLADKVTVDEAASFSAKIPVSMPNDQMADMEVDFSQGVCQKVIVLNSIENCGSWSFPSAQDHITLNNKSYRIDKVAVFSGLLPY
jgi:hypothetical protein